MKRLLTILILFSTCNNVQLKQLADGHELIKPDNKIDYKKNVYHLFLGQTKDSLESTIEIRRNFEAEWNVKPGDSIEHYMNIGEELIQVANRDTTEVLPALYFTFHKGILTGFESPIVFEPGEKNEQAIYNFLISLAPYFGKLKSDNNKRKLSQQLLLKFNDSVREEKFYIDTTRQYEILFNYKTGTK